MKIGLDSATPPTAGQVAAAKAAGIAVWSGYLATKPGVRLLRPWSQAEFTVVKTLPGVPIAFYSGWDDPVACKALAAAWGVRLCLDVEEGIRGDGPWVQANLDASGGGLYSYASAFPNRRMAFAILADRSRTPPDPNATWAAWHPRPGVPCGWQWQGSHNEFGVTVDRNWFDDWFAGSTTGTAGSEVIAREEFMTPSQKYAAIRTQFLIAEPDVAPDNALIGQWASKIQDDGNNVDEIVQNLWSQVPQFAAYRTRLTALLNAGPAKPGPAGPPGPAVDTSQFAKVLHEHRGTITVT